MRSFIYAAFAVLVLASASASSAPFPSVPDSSGAKDDTAYTFTTNEKGSSGVQQWSYTLPGPGIYLATFAANFNATGSPSNPVAFSCVLVYAAKQNVLQSTALSEGDLDWDIGLSGSGIVNVTKSNLTLLVSCGTGDGSAWSFASRPLEVTFVKLAGQVKKSLVDSLAVHRAEAGTTH